VWVLAWKKFLRHPCFPSGMAIRWPKYFCRRLKVALPKKKYVAYGWTFFVVLVTFNFNRFAENHNIDGKNMSDMATFSETISYLGLVELPLKVRSFTWSNMQLDRLLVQLG
jgi:hypothetical protein